MNIKLKNYLATLIISTFFIINLDVLLAADEFIVLSYHDVRDDVNGDLDPDRYAVSTQNFVAQLDWLYGNDYKPVSLKDILDAKAGISTLPEKAVLLTFDDGLKSAYTTVFPLLKAYDFPGVVAIVGKWLEMGPEDSVPYGAKSLIREDFLNWKQLRQMSNSGLIEVVSHSYDMHKGVTANSFNNKLPAASTLEFDLKTKLYESDNNFKKRLKTDLNHSISQIKKHLGVKPRALVWPYGSYSKVGNTIANDLGIDITFSLRHKLATVNDLNGIGRILLYENPELGMFVHDVNHLTLDDSTTVNTVRVAHADLDQIYDPDPEQIHRNLSAFLDRIKQLQVNTVYLQAFADPDGNGSADALYFQNKHLPVKADLFGRVAWQLKTRSNVRVYAWMPVLGYELPDKELQKRLQIPNHAGDEVIRLSPFESESLSIVKDIYSDLARHTYFAGVLFHDDAYLRELDAPQMNAMQRTQALINFTDELVKSVEHFRPGVETARNIFACTIMEPECEAWFGQNFQQTLKHYDYAAVMAMPYMEQVNNPNRWLKQLVTKIGQIDGALDRTIFELQSYDWAAGKQVPTQKLREQFRILAINGVKHYGYYPDFYLDNHPHLQSIRPFIAATDYSYNFDLNS